MTHDDAFYFTEPFQDGSDIIYGAFEIRGDCLSGLAQAIGFDMPHNQGLFLVEHMFNKINKLVAQGRPH